MDSKRVHRATATDYLKYRCQAPYTQAIITVYARETELRG